MCIIWSSVIIAYNSLHTPINYETLTSILSLLYLWWLIRIATLKKSVYVPLELSGAEYNIMMPVNTWRGLAQTLFIPWRNPAYETHILVAHGKITAVVDGVFTQFVYDREHIRGLIKKGGVVRICNNYKKSYIDKLIGKNLILGLRDCRRLEC